MWDPRSASSPGLILAAMLSCLPADASLCDEPAPRVPALDSTFGGVGYVHALFARDGLDLSTVAELPDGKIVVGGSLYAGHGGGVLVGLRYLADGTPDPSFHGTGSVAYNPCQCSYFIGKIAGFRRQADGTLLFVGSTAPRWEPGRGRHESILVLRYADDGTFGTAPGDTGIDLVDLGSSYAVRAAVFPATEGAVFVAGSHDHRLFVAKVRDRGAQLDTESFAAPHGWVAPSVGDAASDAGAMALDDEGRILVAGWVGEKKDRDAMVVRLLPSGALDESFGVHGMFRLARPGAREARGIAVLPDGGILVAGQSEDADARRFLLLRLQAGGGLDRAFGDGGVAVAPLGRPEPDYEHALSMAMMEDGRVIVASNEAPVSAPRPVIARFRPDGSLDPTFGDGGEATFAVKEGPGWAPSSHGGKETELTTVALTQDGKLLVSGMWSSYAYRGFLARLTL